VIRPVDRDFPIIDAHQHFWDVERNHYPWLHATEPIPFRYGDYRAIRRTYLPGDYHADAGPHRIVKTVHVEAEWNPADPVGETRWLEEIARRHAVPSAAVAQAWLDRDDAATVLAAQAAHPIVRGVRHKPRAAASAADVRAGAPGSMGDPAWRRGFALLEEHGLSFDLQTPYWHLYEAAELASAFPRTTIIINHTGLPADRSDTGLAAWRHAMRAVAACHNVAVKISGLGQRGLPWTLDANQPIIRDTIEIFGVERSMFASNFPVDKLVGSFDTIFSGFRRAVADLPLADQRKLFHDSAARIYRLPA
jgi:predicted TIM-barrel fold metal-dependent hydrolase